MQWLDPGVSVHSAVHSLAARWSENTGFFQCHSFHFTEKKEKQKGKQGWDHFRFSYFACFSKSFPNLAVATSVTGRDEVSDAAALQESDRWDGTVCAEDLGEGDHLHQTQTDHGCFSVVSKSQTITETSSYCYDVLQEQHRGRLWHNISPKSPQQTDISFY